MFKPTVRTCQRSFSIIQVPANGTKGLVRVTIKGQSTDYSYDVLRVDPEMGECALELKKLDPETNPPYHVLIASDGSTECDCMGFLRWGSDTGRCKHCDLARPLIDKTRKLQAEHVQVKTRQPLAVRQQSETTLAIESAEGKPVASIECGTGLTDEHRMNASYIAANPAEIDNPERLEANVEQIPGTRFTLEPAFPRLRVADTDGKPLCDIVSEWGFSRSHEKLAAMIRSRPHLLGNIEALQQFIAGTRICVA